MNDTVYRRMAIDSIENIYPSNSWLNYAADVIKALPPANPEHGWIPISKAKPQRYSYVWVTDFGEAEIGYYSSDGRWFDLMGNTLKDVTAWMPPPEPYREEIEDE